LALDFWDWLLVLLVAAFGTISSFVRDPQIKAVFATVPVPFGLAWLAVGLPVGVYNAAGMFLVLVYVHTVRIFHEKGIPILVSIGLGISTYIVGGLFLIQYLLDEPWVFHILTAMAAGTGILLLKIQRHHIGTPYRTPLHPIPKFLAMFGVVYGLALIKQWLLGFTPFFPMMNSITSYEARHSLWVQCRQIPVFLVAAWPMLEVMYSAERHWHWGRAWVLTSGVVLYMVVFLPINHWLRRQTMVTVSQ